MKSTFDDFVRQWRMVSWFCTTFYIILHFAMICNKNFSNGETAFSCTWFKTSMLLLLWSAFVPFFLQQQCFYFGYVQANNYQRPGWTGRHVMRDIDVPCVSQFSHLGNFEARDKTCSRRHANVSLRQHKHFLPLWHANDLRDMLLASQSNVQPPWETRREYSDACDKSRSLAIA